MSMSMMGVCFMRGLFKLWLSFMLIRKGEKKSHKKSNCKYFCVVLITPCELQLVRLGMIKRLVVS